MDITADDLLRDILLFRKKRLSLDHTFSGQYPNEKSIKQWPNQEVACDFRYADLLLSFTASTYENLKSPLVDDLNEQVSIAAAQWEGKSNILSTLAKETARRGAKKLPWKKLIWEHQSEYIQQKYSGYYLLLRIDYNKRLRAELLCLGRHKAVGPSPDREDLASRVKNVQHRNWVRFFWGCENEVWNGDLVIGKNKFSGLALKYDVDELPEPVTINLLRSGELPISFERRPVLTGLLAGWNTSNPHELFRSMFALEKIPSGKNLKLDYPEFCKVLQSEGWKKLVANTENGTWQKKGELVEMFKDGKHRIHKDGAQHILNTDWLRVKMSDWI